MRKAIWIYAILITIALIVFYNCKGGEIELLSTKVEELNKRPLEQDVKFWKDAFNVEHATVEQITLDNAAMNQYAAKLAAQLKIKPKQVDRVSTTKVDIIVDEPLVVEDDTTSIDTCGCRKFYKFSLDKAPWLTVKGVVSIDKSQNHIYITGTDTLVQTNTWKRNWFLGPKKYSSDISNKNPDIKISGIKVIGRRKNDPSWIIAPSFQLGYPVSTKLDWTAPQLMFGASIIYYPLSIKIRNKK